jgi:hypothetical protein
MSGTHRELARLDGNRIWRVQTSSGPVLQKLYAERGSWLHAWGRELASRLRGGKTSTRAAGRRATEARLLALWREHGCDVPAELSAQHPALANARTLVLEFIDGPLLSELLADAGLPRARRDALIARFAADVAARHDRALASGEAALVQEHGGVQHVLVATVQGERASSGADVERNAMATPPDHELRFVSFDLENAFTPRADVTPLLAKEIAGCVRSLARCGKPDAQRLRADVEAFVRGYGHRDRLRAAAAHYLRSPSPLWRAIWALDRRREERRARAHGKFVMLQMLDDILDREHESS